MAQAPDWVWAKTTTEDSTVYTSFTPLKNTTDPWGNIYVVGSFKRSKVIFDSIVLFNNNPLNSTRDIALVKYDPLGNVIWAKSYGGNNEDFISGISVNKLGNVFLTGNYNSSSIRFGAFNLYNMGFSDFFVVKLDSSGNEIWAKSYGGDNDENSGAITSNAKGEVYIAGSFYGSTLTLGNIVLNRTASTSSNADAFILKIDPIAGEMWARSVGGNNYDEIATCLGLDLMGNAYLAGTFESSTINVGSFVLHNITGGCGYPNKDLFIAKYDHAGIVKWAKVAGGSSRDDVSSIAVDKFGSFVIVGNTLGTDAKFDLISINSSHSLNIYTAKYDTLGNAVWVKSAWANDVINAESVVLDIYGNSYLNGCFLGSQAAFDANFILGTNFFIVKYDKYGNLRWIKSAEHMYAGFTWSNSIDSIGNIFVSGVYGCNGLMLDSLFLPHDYSDPCVENQCFVAKLSNLIVGVISTDVTCRGGNNGSATVNVVGGIQPFTYLWNTSPPQITQAISGLDAGNYSVTVTDSLGVISVSEVVIADPEPIITNVNHILCNGTSYSFNGINISNTGNYSDTLVSFSGCDSIVNLMLIPDPMDTTDLNVELCFGDSYDFYGATINTGGTFYKTISAVNNCDSVLVAHVTVYPISRIDNYQTICAGELYYINGNSYSQTGAYIDTLMSIRNCDSIVTTILTVNPNYIINNPQTICTGEFYLFNNHTYSIEGNYIDSLNTINGCDSIILTGLVVNPTYQLNESQIICDGSTFLFNGNNYDSSGIYVDSLITVSGCDSIIQLTLVVAPIDTTSQLNYICKGSGFDFYGLNLTDNGVYYKSLISSFGCDSVIEMELINNALPEINAGSDETIFKGESIQLNATGNGDFMWTPNLYLDNADLKNPVSTPNNSISYEVLLVDSNGCSARDSINIIVEKSKLWVPNVFSPNDANPVNKTFHVSGIGISEFLLVIYDRWGEKVFESHDISQGWNGCYKGKELSTAVYGYYVKAIFFDGEVVEKKGDFTLLR